MLKLLLKVSLIAGVIAAAVYFTPADIKRNITDYVSAVIGKIIPTSLKSKVEEKLDPFINTPIERRAKLLAQLKENIQALKQNLEVGPATTPQDPTAPPPPPTPPEEIIAALEETEKLIEKLEEINEDQSVTNKITTNVVDSITGLGGSSSNENKTEENPPSSNPPAPNCSWICPAQ